MIELVGTGSGKGRPLSFLLGSRLQHLLEPKSWVDPPWELQRIFRHCSFL